MSRFCFFCTYLLCFSLASQTPDFYVRRVHASTGLPAIIEFPASSGNIPNLENAGTWIIRNLNASPGFRLQYYKTFFGQDSQYHTRFRQYFGRFPVEHAEVILHQKGQRTRLLNGVFYPRLSADTAIAVGHDQALETALSLFAGSRFAWTSLQEEQLLKKITGNPKSTYLPKGSLVILNTGTAASIPQFRLAYKFDIYALEPLSRKFVYVDALTGDVLGQLERLCSIDKTGIAYTKFSGVQSITCDSIAHNTFRLCESGRGKGIATLNGRMINMQDGSDFIDDDNIWNNINKYKDEIATDAHWGSEMTYDYYLSKFNRNGYNDSGMPIVSKVHSGDDMNNAYWTGDYIIYGDGDNVSFLPFTSIDICGHELTHAYTQYSAGLIYEEEPGALNESFSDIFGKCVEHEVLASDFSWICGEKIALSTTAQLRNMADPLSFNMPKFYFGLRYYSGPDDLGGVHINSSIQNYWFYLLCHGGEGIREDNNKHFKVEPIGMERAARVAYLALNAYLTPTSQYIDMSFLSIDAAAQLYGQNSMEMRQVQNAWFAVGLFDFFSPVDAPAILSQNWSLAPNPSSGLLFLSNTDTWKEAFVQMTDLTGRPVMSAMLAPGHPLDVSSLTAGIYFITVNGKQTLKFIRE